MEDMRKQASTMRKRYEGATLMSGGGISTKNKADDPTFEANFADTSESHVEEDGADLEIPKDQLDVSDISSNDGLA